MPQTSDHAFITGGSSGIGLSMARRLVGRGVPVTILARGRDRLADAHAALLRERPDAWVRAVSADVQDAEAMRIAIDEAEEAFGPVDMVVASAGVTRPGRFEHLGDEVFRDLMEINYFGALNVARPALEKMRRRGKGTVCLIGSGAGLIGIYGYSAYAPTKFALRGLAETLRAEFAEDGVLVSVAHPPDTDTPQLAQERDLRPPETEAICGRGGLRKPDRVAKSILRGLDRGRAEITPGLQVFALARLVPIVRPLFLRWMDRVAEEARG